MQSKSNAARGQLKLNDNKEIGKKGVESFLWCLETLLFWHHPQSHLNNIGKVDKEVGRIQRKESWKSQSTSVDIPLSHKTTYNTTSLLTIPHCYHTFHHRSSPPAEIERMNFP